MRSLVVSLPLLLACSNASTPAPVRDATAPRLDDAVADGGAASSQDAPVMPADAPLSASCRTPDDCAWLEDYERDVVARLSGARPIAPGVTLTRRSTPSQRATARAYLVAAFDDLGIEASLQDYGTGANVRGRLPATTSAAGALIVVGAHYDGVPAGPAAADDGTGVALVLSAARFLRELPRRDHPIEFVLFDQEEVGLVGSAAYVASLRAGQTAIDGAHCFDMISFDGNGDRAIELWSPSPSLQALYELHGASRGVPVRAVRFTSSDHQSFLARGLSAVGVGEEFVGNDHTPHYHRATDTYDRVDFAYLAQVTRLALAVLADRAVD